MAWCGSDACEEALGEGTGASIRAILGEDPVAPTCLVDGAPARHTALVARAYCAPAGAGRAPRRDLRASRNCYPASAPIPARWCLLSSARGTRRAPPIRTSGPANDMRVTFLGQAGLYIETDHGTILCDPWFNPAFFASWFPFPSNEDVDVEAISHPDYPINHLEQELGEIGFHRFVKTRSAEPVELDGLRVMIVALVAPTDGPIGDSGLAVDDGRTRLFNQNDSRPIDLEPLRGFGSFDAHFLQFSGAIWYPMVYDFPPRMKQTLGRKKRQNEMARAKRYAEEIGASYVFPSAGPPCFLDPDLFELNDFDRDSSNVFPDQTVFLEYLREHGMEAGRLLLPGSVATLEDGGCQVRHPTPDAVERIFSDKRAYLKEYQARKLPEIERRKATWARGQVEDVVGALKGWWEPLLAQANLTCEGINGRVLLEVADERRGDEQIVIDYLERRVDAWKGEPFRYRFRIDRALVETCIVHHEEDWVNELFLS